MIQKFAWNFASIRPLLVHAHALARARVEGLAVVVAVLEFEWSQIKARIELGPTVTEI